MVTTLGSELLNTVRRFFGRRAQAPVQRRRNVRVAVPGGDVTCCFGQQRVKGFVRDASSDGVRLVLSRPVAPAQLISLSLDRADGDAYALQGRVIWCRVAANAFEVGVSLLDRGEVLDQSWVRGLVASDACERRGSRRLPDNRRAFIRSNASSTRSIATVVDLSEGGALVQTRRLLDPGVYVRLSSEGAFDLEARVVRVRPMGDGTMAVSLQFVSPSAAESRALQSHLERLAAA